MTKLLFALIVLCSITAFSQINNIAVKQTPDSVLIKYTLQGKTNWLYQITINANLTDANLAPDQKRVTIKNISGSYVKIGNNGIIIQPAGENNIWWNYKADNAEFDNNVVFQISAQAYKPFQKKKLLLINTTTNNSDVSNYSLKEWNNNYYQPVEDEQFRATGNAVFLKLKSDYKKALEQAAIYYQQRNYPEAINAYKQASRLKATDKYAMQKALEVQDKMLLNNRNFTPNLYANLSFKDANGNGILEANEKGTVNITLWNDGKGYANELMVTLTDSANDNTITAGYKSIKFIRCAENAEISIPIEANADVATTRHKLQLVVTEKFGFDMEPVYLVLNTYAYQAPQLNFAGFDIVDQGEGTSTITPDGLLQANEKVRVKIVIQNIGQGEAKKVNYQISTTDPYLYIDNKTGQLGNIAVAQTKDFWFTLTTTARTENTGNLPITLSVTEADGTGSISDLQLPLALNKKPVKPTIIEVKANIADLYKNVAKFEYKSNRIKANTGNLTDIKNVSPSLAKRKNAIGIIIGIERYDNMPPAPYAANDATVMEQFFKNKLGIDNIILFRNEEVTGSLLRKIFNPQWGELQRAVVKDQTDVFVYYSGHGVPNKAGDNVFLFPSDGVIEGLADFGLNINEMYQNLNMLQARSVTIFIDACFSGSSRITERVSAENLSGNKGVKIKPKLIQPWSENNNYSVFNSSSNDETSLGFDEAQNGLFTYFLAAGMQGAADTNFDHKITLGELNNYVTQNVIELSKKIRGQQTPDFKGNANMVLFEY